MLPANYYFSYIVPLIPNATINIITIIEH